MDNRSKLEKILAHINDPNCNENIRKVAQSMFDKMCSNSELAINPTCEEAYRRYQEAYAGVIQIKVGSVKLPKRVRPVAVCNDGQMRKIFSMYTTWPDILTAMRRCVGCRGNEVTSEKDYLKQWEAEVYT